MDDRISLLEYVNSRRTTGTKHQYRQSLCLFFECLTGKSYPGQSRTEDHLVSMSSPENLPAIKADLQSQAEISRTLVGENVRLKQQLDAEKIEREAQSRRIAAIEAALMHRG